MGDAADDILNGLCCDQCGEYFEDQEAPGHPQTCAECADELDDEELDDEDDESLDDEDVDG
jgi:hypothetical protein